VARAFSRIAGKDYPEYGIKKGDTYYYWSVGFRGRKQMSKTPPRQSQLTGSKMSGAYAAQETAQDTIGNATTPEEFAQALNDAADEIESVADEYQEAADATTGNGNRVPNADEMQEKADGLRDWAESLRNDAGEIENLSATDYVDDTVEIESIDSNLIDEEEEKCDHCDGTGRTPENVECGFCDGAGSNTVRKRKDVDGFDDLTEDEQQAMLEAARELAEQNLDCPL
jgi:hypothetical protein